MCIYINFINLLISIRLFAYLETNLINRDYKECIYSTKDTIFAICFSLFFFFVFILTGNRNYLNPDDEYHYLAHDGGICWYLETIEKAQF